VMKVHIDHLNTMILFVLAFLLAAATGPAAAQQPVSPDSVEAGIPSQVHQLIELLDDPTVRTWMDQQRAARNLHQIAPVRTQAPLSTFTATQLALLRQHIQTLAAALPTLPGEFRQTGSILLGELRDWELIIVVLLAAGFALLGVSFEWLFWRATARVRARLLNSKLDPLAERLRVVTTRFAIGLGQVIAFALGSVGAFLPFDWPPLLRHVVLGYLLAFLALRLSLVIGRFLLAPKEGFRIIPVTTPQARFWYLRLALFIGWFAFGYITVEQFSLLGTSREAQQILAYTLGLGLLGIGLESIWRRPRVSGDPPSRIGVWLLSACFVALWLLWVTEVMPLFWFVTVAVALPMAIRLTQRAVNHILRPPNITDPVANPSPDSVTNTVLSPLAVALERGTRAALIIAATLLLTYVWGIDLIELSARDTLPTRLLHGALSAIVIVLIADFAWHVIRAAIDRKLTQASDPAHADNEQARRQSRLRTLLPILRNVLFIVLIVMAGLMALSSMGIEIGPLIAGAGVIGVAIGFGAQTLVKDIISGMFYLLDDAFRIGEYIQSGSYKGTVESFSLRSIKLGPSAFPVQVSTSFSDLQEFGSKIIGPHIATERPSAPVRPYAPGMRKNLKLRHHRGPLYTVPFGSLGAVQNMSRDWVIDKLTVSVTYDTDLAAVKKIIKRVGAELAADAEFAPHIIETLKMQGVNQFGDFAVQIQMKMMTKPGEQFVIRRRAYALIKSAFETNGIKFAFPTVHVAGGHTNDSPTTGAAVGQMGLELVKKPPI
jgi:small-conductance mechanosensitive channel